MNYLRRSDERGQANFGWLDSKHSFSFGSYYDPAHMGFGHLRVINDDTVSPSAGFDTHSHRDMEIITYVIKGALKHRDSMGNEGVITEGEVQRMSAGTGITHSEFNASEDDSVHFLQIWILPEREGVTPGYEQAQIVQAGTRTPLVTSDGREGSLSMNQDAAIERIVLKKGESVTLETARPAYIHVVTGEADSGSEKLKTGDGAGFAPGGSVTLCADSDTFEALWFTLPG